jgi:hypothetical protein
MSYALPRNMCETILRVCSMQLNQTHDAYSDWILNEIIYVRIFISPRTKDNVMLG